MIFLNEDLLTDNYIVNESIEESLLSISESINDFTENALNADIAMQETLMESVYLEANGDEPGAIKRFFNGILQFVKDIWNKIKEFVGNVYMKMTGNSKKIASLISDLLNDQKYSDALKKDLKITGMKYYFLNSMESVTQDNGVTKFLPSGTPTLVDGSFVKTLVGNIEKNTADIDKLVKRQESLTKNKASIDTAAFSTLNAISQSFGVIGVTTGKKEETIKGEAFLKEYQSVATSSFDKNFKNTIKKLKENNSKLEKAAKDAIGNANDKDDVKYRKAQCKILRSAVSAVNKAVGKTVVYRSAYNANAYKVVSAVRKEAKNNKKD